MRSVALLFVALVAFSPLPAHAATPTPQVRPAMSPTKCPAGTSTEAPPRLSLELTVDTTQAQAEAFLKKALYCPNACYDLAAKLTLTYTGVQVDVLAKHTCTSREKAPNDPAQNPKRGCAAGETKPQFSLTTKDVYSTVIGFRVPDQTISKTRCDEAALEKAMNKFFNGLKAVSDNPAAGQQQMLAALSELKSAAEPTPIPNVQTPAEMSPASNAPVNLTPDQLRQTLQDRFKLSATQAEELVRTNPNDVSEMVTKANNNDLAGAQDVARRLNLNDDVIKNIAQLEPAATPAPQTVEPPVEDPTKKTETTFQQPPTATGLPTQCGVEGLAGNIMRAESTCGRINSNPLSSVQGPYHFLCSTWQAYARATGNGQYADCQYRNDPTISTNVMNARMQQFADMYGARCQQAGISASSCQYAIHVFGEGGFRQLYNAYVANPNAGAWSVCGAGLQTVACTNNASIFNKGGTVAGIFNELDRRLGGSGTVIPSIAVAASPFSSFTSPQAPITSYGPAYSQMNPLSSFLGANPSYSTNGSFSPASSFGQSSPFSSLMNVFGNLFNSNQQTQNQAQQAVVSIIAQPQTVYVGASMVVSWSSVGVRSGSCRVMQHEQSATKELASSHEGSVSIQASARGSLTFAITCLNGAGAPIQQVTTVTVQ